MIERKIGEIFKFNRKKLEVIEQYICKGCYFNDDGICRHVDINKTGDCSIRSDRKSVIFKEV